jgi:hypothetical protein
MHVVHTRALLYLSEHTARKYQRVKRAKVGGLGAHNLLKIYLYIFKINKGEQTNSRRGTHLAVWSAAISAQPSINFHRMLLDA